MPWSQKAFAESINEDMYIFLKAVEDNNIVGYISLYKSFDEGDVVNLAVKEEYRRRGIATKLLESLIEWCKENGIGRLLLDVRESNNQAISLYSKKGFERLYIRKDFYDKPKEDGVVMQLKLANDELMESITTI